MFYRCILKKEKGKTICETVLKKKTKKERDNWLSIRKEV